MISVLTLVRGRQKHLDRLINSLCAQTNTDFELVVSYMQQDLPLVADNLPFSVRLVKVAGATLPLAAARNIAAQSAQGEHFIFLDVDCIASPDLVSSYAKKLACYDRVLMGEVRYLPDADYDEKSFVELVSLAVKHPARPVMPDGGIRPESNPRRLWGLSFALARRQFEIAGGFDERFIGYGGEETDFAERLAKTGASFAWCANALALHQYHPVYSPPLDRFADIIRNARLFHAIWGSWCMEYWLQLFHDKKYVEWLPGEGVLAVQRPPTVSEIAASQRPATEAFG